MHKTIYSLHAHMLTRAKLSLFASQLSLIYAGLKVDLTGGVTDSIEASSLSYKNNYIQVYSNSWGPSDKGFIVEKPGTLLENAFENAVTKVLYLALTHAPANNVHRVCSVSRVVMGRAPFSCGLLGMVDGTMILVLLMAIHPASTLLQWGQQIKPLVKQATMNSVLERWLSLIHSTQKHSQKMAPMTLTTKL